MEKAWDDADSVPASSQTEPRFVLTVVDGRVCQRLLESLLQPGEVNMSAGNLFQRAGIVGAAWLLAAFAAAAQQGPRDWTLHNSSLLTITTPTSYIQIESAEGGRAEIKLATQRFGDVHIVAESFTVTMPNGGFTLTGTGGVVMSGAYSLRADSMVLRVSADGRSVLEVKGGVKAATGRR